MIVRVCSVVLRRTVVGVDWLFDNLSGSHRQRTMKPSHDGFRSGCRNVSQHQQQSFSGLYYKPGRSLKPQHWLTWVQTFHCYKNLFNFPNTQVHECHIYSTRGLLKYRIRVCKTNWGKNQSSNLFINEFNNLSFSILKYKWYLFKFWNSALE